MGGFCFLSSFTSGRRPCWTHDDALDLESYTIFALALFRSESNTTANSLSAQPDSWTLPFLVGGLVGLLLISSFSSTEEPKTNTNYASFGWSRVDILLDPVSLRSSLHC